MPRLSQVARADTTHPVVHAMYDLVFGKDVEPVLDAQEGATSGTATGSEGDWWTTYALVPDILEHAVAGFVMYRSPNRTVDPVLREIAQSRAGWAAGSKFVYSQHVQALRGLGADEAKIRDIPAWSASDAYTRVERAVLGFTDAIVYDHGRVSDELFAILREELSDEQILELTYITAMYLQHAVVTRALRLEWDDRPEAVTDVEPPEEFDAEHYVSLGTDEGTKERFDQMRG